MDAMQKQNNFKSDFINTVLSLFYSAENMVKDRQSRIEINRANYKDQILDEMNQMEKQRCQNNLDGICSKMEKLHDKEIELLIKQKESDLRQPPNRTLENLTNIKDIITEDELQLYADKCKGSALVQRRIRSIANERGFHIDTYPEFDEKINAVQEITSVFINYVKYNNFGLDATIYIKENMQNYDKILC